MQRQKLRQRIPDTRDACAMVRCCGELVVVTIHSHSFGIDSLDHDSDGSGHNARRSKPGNGTTNDENDGGRRSTADSRANLEQEDTRQKRPFRAVKRVDTSIDENETTGREQVTGAIPTNVVDRMELIRDSRNSSGDDGSIQRDEEHAYVETQHNHESFRFIWINDFRSRSFDRTKFLAI